MTDPQFTTWRKSTRSSGGSNCVEVAIADDAPVVGMRDTKNRATGTLVFTSHEWQAFIGGVREGEFDLE